MSKATDAQIARINELSQLARTAWFSLLGYLVFVGITLLGVRDADFFVPSRQTDLPLVNVAIPTASFFWIAPILGAALYTYLHLFLIKLWDAHGVARTTDADATHHWLVGDFVLIRQRDPTALARPLAFLTDWITRLLVWAAGPIVLAYAWWRSMPAHDEWLTLLIGVCLWLTLVVGFTSWWRAEACLRPWRRHRGTWLRRPAAAIAALLLVIVSWLRTEGGLDQYVVGGWTLDDAAIVAFVITLARTDPETTLVRTDLAGVELVPLPDDWRTPETARSAFRETWCKREGLTMEVCDQPVGPDHTTSASVTADRQGWCEEHGHLARAACLQRFADLDARFADAWEAERASARANLPVLDVQRRDLRNTSASGASLIGANLSFARLEGAHLNGARLEGANLSFARLEGAYLWLARLEGANLSQARLEEAKLSGARLEGAYLWLARLEGADLSLARLEGADLSLARLEGADLGSTQLKAANLRGAHLSQANLRGARLEGADLRYADFRNSEWAGASTRGSPAHFSDFRGVQELTQAQLGELIGNRDTLLPQGNAPDTAQPFYIWSCWETPPPGYDALVKFVNDPEISRTFLCGDEPRRKTGTPLALEAPYRPGHPLAGSD